MKKLLFVCEGNTCRSPMASALARHILGSARDIASAGIEAAAGDRATAPAVQVMKERGLDITSHRASGICDHDLASFDLIVAMTPPIAERLKTTVGETSPPPGWSITRVRDHTGPSQDHRASESPGGTSFADSGKAAIAAVTQRK